MQFNIFRHDICIEIEQIFIIDVTVIPCPLVLLISPLYQLKLRWDFPYEICVAPVINGVRGTIKIEGPQGIVFPCFCRPLGKYLEHAVVLIPQPAQLPTGRLVAEVTAIKSGTVIIPCPIGRDVIHRPCPLTVSGFINHAFLPGHYKLVHLVGCPIEIIL